MYPLRLELGAFPRPTLNPLLLGPDLLGKYDKIIQNEYQLKNPFGRMEVDLQAKEDKRLNILEG